MAFCLAGGISKSARRPLGSCSLGEAIAAMGDKIELKKAAAAAKVSTVPGHYLGVIESDAEAIKIAEEIGIP